MTRSVGAKYFLVQLRKCEQCSLLFRWPKDTPTVNLSYYSSSYTEFSGITTDMPSEEGLKYLLETGFVTTDKDATRSIARLRKYKPQGMVLDFGASWGYNSWQLEQAGYCVIGFEVDKARATYGREHLDLQILDAMEDLAALPGNSFDIIFTTHTLEHLPNLFTVFDLFHRLLRPRGLLFATVPNCTGIERHSVFRAKKSFAFGEKHTFAFTTRFFAINLPDHGFTIREVDISPHHQSPIEAEPQDVVAGVELAVVAEKSSRLAHGVVA